jgi:hypothetical protein
MDHRRWIEWNSEEDVRGRVTRGNESFLPIGSGRIVGGPYTKLEGIVVFTDVYKGTAAGFYEKAVIGGLRSGGGLGPTDTSVDLFNPSKT